MAYIIMLKNATLRRKKTIINKRKDIITKKASTNKTKGPMQGSAQVENLVKKAKTYTIISAYMNIKWRNLVCAMNGGMHMILQDQVHGYSTSNVVHERLVRVCVKKFVKTFILKRLLLLTDLQYCKIP